MNEIHKDTRAVAAFLGMGLAALGMVLLFFFGVPSNGLHTQGLGWCGTIFLASLLSIVGSSALDRITTPRI